MLEGATISPLGLCPPVLGRPVQYGPQMISIPGISGVPVTNNTTGAFVSYRWPQRLVLREMILVPQSALAADAARLELFMSDEQGALAFDGTGVAADAQRIAALAFQGQPSRLALAGLTYVPQWAPFTRLVEPGDRWSFQITNTKAGGGSITPRLWFKIEVPLR